jgi:DHA2 family multidrug resistance protein
MWDHRATLHHAQLVERLGAGDPASSQVLATLQAAGSSAGQAQAMLNHIVDQQAYMLGVNDMFYVSALLFLALIAVVWLARPAPGGAGPAVVVAD